ncbi:hypothetical protein [Magnetococcus sp. PR-3]|uniref:hypothetical protein n=1 Tax=Magnetococcus sp. PR-3 TaxID=3120355 RepID=UPI002FCE4455
MSQLYQGKPKKISVIPWDGTLVKWNEIRWELVLMGLGDEVQKVGDSLLRESGGFKEWAMKNKHVVCFDGNPKSRKVWFMKRKELDRDFIPVRSFPR